MDAERAILGSVLLNNDALALVRHWITERDFYVVAHSTIFSGMLELQEDGVGIDTVTLGSLLTRKGELARVGGPMVFDGLLDSVATVANVEHYARIVAEKSAVRRVIHAAQGIVADGFADTWDAEDYLIESQSAISKAASAFAERGDTVKELGDGIVETARRAIEGRDPTTLIKTGISAIDQSVGGLWPKELTVIGGRPGMGKSAFALNLAINADLAGRRSLIFTLEDGIENFQQRALAIRSRATMNRIRRRAVQDPEKLLSAAERLREVKIGLNETPGLSAPEIYSKAVAYRAKHGSLDLLIIDHLRRMRGRGQSRYDRVSDSVQRCADMAKDLGIPVVLLAQLNRKLEEREDKRPRASDLRESGTIEEDARAIWFLYRPWVYDRDADEHEAELIVSKSNHGSIGTIKLWCSMSEMRFLPWAGIGTTPSDPFEGETRDMFPGSNGDDY